MIRSSSPSRSTISPCDRASAAPAAGPGPHRRPLPGSPFAGLVALLLLLVSPVLATGPGPTGALAGQDTDGRTGPLVGAVESRIAPVPFGPGERNEYQVRLGPVSVGEGAMEISGVVPIRGRPSYHVDWQLEGGIPLARVDDHYQSWFDVETLASRRFIQDIQQVRHENYRHFEIFPEEGRWQLMGGEDGEMITDRPLDEIAFLYYVRTLDLEVGETYELDRYFRADRNPVILRVLRREVVEVPAGTFETIVVQPIIKAGGLFGEGGEAEVYFTDDADRILVKLESRVPVVGSLSLHLTEWTEGRRLKD